MKDKGIFKKKAKFNSLYGKSIEDYKELEDKLKTYEYNVNDLLFEINRYKEKLYYTEQKNKIISSKNEVIKAIEERIINDCKSKGLIDTDLITVYNNLIKGE